MFAGKDLEQRFANGRLAQVQRSVVESCNLGLAPESLDVAMIVMSYHDLYHYDPRGWPRIDANAFLEQVRRAVKPGGVFLWAAPSGGLTVTGGTGDILQVANSGSGTGVTYSIVIVGASA